MGRVTVTFEAENQDELLGDIATFLGESRIMSEAPPIPLMEEPAKPKRGRKSKKQKEEEAATVKAEEAPPADPPAAPGEPSLDLSMDAEEELPMPENAELNATLRELMEAKGEPVAAKIMEEFGGSIKMLEIPKENYPKLWAEAKKAISA